MVMWRLCSLEKDPKARAGVDELLAHPWLKNNRDEKLLKQYIKLVEHLRKKT
jgi:hypothetical protein